MTFNDFLSPLIPLFQSVTKNHGLDYADSQDVIQETSLALWRKFSDNKIDLSKNTKSYALQLVNWRAKDCLDKRKRRSELFYVVGEDNDLDTLPECEKQQKKRFPAKIFTYARRVLKPRDYEIFTDHFLHGKKTSDTAKHFGLDKSAIHMIRCRMLKKIKKHYNVRPI